MSSRFPSFIPDPLGKTKRFNLIMAVLTIVLLFLLVFEIGSYLLTISENDRLSVKIDRYQTLVAETSNEGANESLYLAFKKKLAAFEGVIDDADPIPGVLDYFETHLDSDSAIDRVLYDTRKLQALVYVKAKKPTAFERSIVPEGASQGHVSILSKQQYDKEGYRMIYELRVAL